MEALKKADIISIFRFIRDNMENHKDELTRLDSELGDGDLGLTMCKGFQVICNDCDQHKDETDIGAFIKLLGLAMSDAVPSTMGTLLSLGIIKSRKAVAGKQEIEAADTAKMLSAAADAISTCGKTRRGDKTILDALYPALDSLQAKLQQNCSLKEAIGAALDGAEAGAANTKNMKSTIGKAAVYGEQSIGKQDPGATVAVIILEGIFNFLNSSRD